jgi:seryl-tRNA synthetase
MLDIKFIRENADKVKKNCVNRNVKCDVDRLLALYEEANKSLREFEELSRKKNELNEKIPKASDSEREKLIAEAKVNSEKLNAADKAYEAKKSEFLKLLYHVPNITHKKAPIGKEESENKEIKIYGEPPKFAFTPKGHEELMKDLDLIDFERGAKVAGSKFYYLKNEAVFLEQALINFALDILAKKGFQIFTTPDLARDNVLCEMGFIPRGEETQIYSIEQKNIKNDDKNPFGLSLIGTAEIAMGGYHMDETIAEEKLPLRYAALSHCFRTEAGSYGRHSAGLYRVHQFSKVEMFVYSKPEESEKMHQELLKIEVDIFKKLGVPFRVIDICTGDLGGPAFRKYDLEAWMTSRNGWGEVTSTSNTTDYQARGLNIKIQKKDGTKEFAHLLNGTAIAVSRALIAVIENYQQADGSIIIPKILKKWMPKGMEAIKVKSPK